MSIVNLAALQAAAVKDKDFTQTTEGGSFTRELPAVGVGFARLREYVELGIHQHGKGAHAKDRPLARFVFELTHKKHIITFEKDGKEINTAHTMSVTVPISDNESSDYIKIFRLLNWKGQYKHPIEALDAPVMCKISHSDNGKDGKEKREYANLWTGTPKDKSWQILPPIKEADPMDDESKPVNIAKLIPALCGGEASIKVFLWLHADNAQWDTLFIEGTKTVKKGDKEVEESKNWLQDRIRSAKNFAGSPMDQLLAAGGEEMDLPTSEEEVTNQNQATEDALSDLGL